MAALLVLMARLTRFAKRESWSFGGWFARPSIVVDRLIFERRSSASDRVFCQTSYL